jgi:nicotinamidase-related amidase
LKRTRPQRSRSAHGLVDSGARRSRTALLLVDVINDLSFPGAGALVHASERMSHRLARLAARAREAGLPVIYVNDNFGQWRSDWRAVIDRCLSKGAPGHRVAAVLKPSEGDYFVLKPKHSGFFSTTLDLLLRNLGVDVLILTGIAADICILFTANDAHMRDYRVVVPHDCVAANTPRKREFALRQIRETLGGETPSSGSLTIAALKKVARTGGGRDGRMRHATERASLQRPLILR